MRLKRSLAVVTALILGAVMLPAAAQAQRRCLITAQSSPAVANYDPFNPAPLNLTNVTINFARGAAQGGAKAMVIDMYIRASSATANGIQLIPISAVGAGNGTGYNQDIFYGTNEAVPNITVPLPSQPIPGVFRWEFNGANPASDNFSVNFNIQLPNNLNFDATTNIVFDIEYGCNGTGGGPQFSERNVAPNAFTLSVNVLSALQASFVGPALDFNEVGDKTDVDVTSTPIVRNGDIRVASSGPYSISMTSQNNYRMTYAGGNPATEVQNLRYETTFLGQVRNPGNTATITRTCTRAGLGAPPLSGGVLLPVSVRLLEGGIDEVPSAAYQDNLIVTVSPLAATTPGVTCP